MPAVFCHKAKTLWDFVPIKNMCYMYTYIIVSPQTSVCTNT